QGSKMTAPMATRGEWMHGGALVGGLLAGCLLAACAAPERPGGATAGGASPGAAAPDAAAVGAAPAIELADLERLHAVLAEKHGRPVFVNFWATWCGPCVKELPDLAALAREEEAAG